MATRPSDDVYTRVNVAGQIEFLDSKTHQVLFVEKLKRVSKAGKDLIKNRPQRKITTTTRTVVGPNGELTDLVQTSGGHWDYNAEDAARVLDKVAEGMTMSEIAKIPGYPPFNSIRRWRDAHADFALEMKKARAGRAEIMHDKILEAADEVDEDNFQAKRTQIDAWKWAAKVNDPDTFGDKTKITGDVNVATTFIIDTGVYDKPIEVEAEVKDAG